MKVDPALVQMLAERLKEDARKKEEFINSDKFKIMLEAFKKPYAVQTDTENLAYFFETEQRKLGWGSDVTLEDAMQFMNCIGDENSGKVTPGSRVEHPGTFESWTFQNYGLWVSILVGQGSIYYVGNDAAKLEWDANI